MVLADVELIEVQILGVVDEIDVMIECQHGIFAWQVERHHEEGEFHGVSALFSGC